MPSIEFDASVDPALWFYALDLIGTPYKWGGDDPSGFDCSGMSIELYQSVGLLPHDFDTTSQGLFNRFSYPDFGVEATQAKFASLAYYGKSKKHITHVVFCLDSVKCLTASGGGPHVNTYEEAVKCNAFVKMRPIHYRRDLVAFTQPNGPIWA